MDFPGQVAFHAAFCPMDARRIGHLELTVGDELHLGGLQDERRYTPFFDSKLSNLDGFDYLKVKMECRDLVFKRVQFLVGEPEFRTIDCELVCQPSPDVAVANLPLECVFEKAMLQEGKRLCFHWWPVQKCTPAAKSTVFVDVHLYKGRHNGSKDEESLVDRESCAFQIDCSCENKVTAHNLLVSRQKSSPTDSVTENQLFHGKEYQSSPLMAQRTRMRVVSTDKTYT